MTILVVRSEPGASEFAGRLRSEGVPALAAPVTRILPVDAALQNADAAQAVVFTSANSVHRFAEICARRDLVAFGVGDATAALAERAGFQHVHNARSDVQGLLICIQKHLPETGAPILYPTAQDVAGDLQAELSLRGYTVERAVVYRAEASDKLEESVDEALRTRTSGGAAIFSARNARIFGALLHKGGHSQLLSGMYALCMSDKVVEALRGSPVGTKWLGITAASSPNAATMAKQIRELATRDTG